MQNRYRELMRCSRLWRQMKYRKWHGFAHTPDKPVPPGGLALFCAACPQPGINLPEKWTDDPDEFVFKFIYTHAHLRYSRIDGFTLGRLYMMEISLRSSSSQRIPETMSGFWMAVDSW